MRTVDAAMRRRHGNREIIPATPRTVNETAAAAMAPPMSEASPTPPPRRRNPLAQAVYLKSVHHLRDLPPDGREVAIAGRSNAGKSSAINAMSGQSRLARTSKTPGRTQQLVFFDLGAQRYLVDLPGYGFAKVPPDLRKHWAALIDRYFRERESLAGLVVVMDIRHPLKPFDQEMIGYAARRNMPCHVLLTKADKLGRGQQSSTLAAVRRELPKIAGQHASVQLFSATSKQGVDDALAVLGGWLGEPQPETAANPPEDNA